VKTIPLAILAFLDSAQDADDHFDVILDVGGVITRFR
jgi:hypothetical protein